MKYFDKYPWLHTLLAVFAGGLMLLLPAIYNGYPLVNSDDGTYMTSGFNLETPGDRPIVYGLLLRIFSLNGVSLWLAVFTQTCILSWLLLKICERLLPGRGYTWQGLAIILFLSLFSAASWTASEIIPDICTSIAFLALTLLVLGHRTKAETIFLYCVYGVAIATHMSHFLIFLGILVIVFLIKRWFVAREKWRRVNSSILVMVLITFSTLLAMRRPMSNSKHVFFIASMLEKGILKEYLSDHCPEKNYRLCTYDLPTDPNVFLWDPNSPLYKEGGWEATKTEYSEIVTGSLTEPKYIWLHMQASLKGTWHQFQSLHLAEGNFPFPKGTHVYNAVASFVPNDTLLYENAWQHKDNIVPKLKPLSSLTIVVVIVSTILLIILLLLKRQKLSSSLRFFIFLSFLVCLVNNWDCATFAQVNARYGSRIIWVIPLCALMAVFHIRTNTEAKKSLKSF
jgi:hypothetical protein